MIQITATTYVAKEVSYDIAEDARETEAIARMQAHLSRWDLIAGCTWFPLK